MSLSQVNSYTDNIGVFHWLLNFNVLVREYLHLLATIPEARIENIQQD